MIVPRPRLLFWVAAVVLPFALLAAVEPQAGTLSVVCVAALGLVAAGDAFNARKTFQGLGMELPPVVRMTKDRESRIELRVRNPSQCPRVLRIALALPPQIHAAIEELDAALPDGTEWSQLHWMCTPRRRGHYRIEAAYVQGCSPLGFWAVRRQFAIASEIRVYPNLLGERRQLAALFLNRGAFGVHAQRQIGKGRDFEKLREYVPGDGFDEIHWKATARRGRPITKVFQIEKTQEVYVAVDASRLSAREMESNIRGWQTTPKSRVSVSPDTALERFVTAALVLGLAAEQQGDLFGLITFSDRIEQFVRARNGKAHYSACRDALYALQPRTVTPDFDELCTFVRLRMRRRALLVVLTSLDDPALSESFVRNVDLIRRQHLILVHMIRPRQAAPLFSDPDVASTDDLYERLGGHLRWQQLRELGKVLQRRGVHFSMLENERLSAELVSQYLNVKQRQLL